MKLSIGLITYNHRAFIEQAVSGILAQRTNFEYEIIVGEDYSTDGTRQILLRMQEEHPGKICMLDAGRNLGMIQNYIRTFEACRGEYVALLDGDDYWCDENKLQRQVDFLDQNPEYSISFHAVRWTYEDHSLPDKVVRPKRGAGPYDLSDLLVSMFVTTCSAVVRRSAVGEFPGWIQVVKTMDYPIMVLAAGNGKIGYIDDVMAIYRVHSGGLWTSMNMIDRLITNLVLLENANPHFSLRYDNIVQSRYRYYWGKMADEFYDAVTAEPSWEAGSRMIDTIFERIKELSSIPTGWKQEQLSRVLFYFLIYSYQAGEYAGAWECWLHLVRVNPRVLGNRGVLVMGAGSVFDGRMRPALMHTKKIYRRARGERVQNIR
jgi:glycosyltransferase involved in cell wall biosynthesis